MSPRDICNADGDINKAGRLICLASLDLVMICSL